MKKKYTSAYNLSVDQTLFLLHCISASIVFGKLVILYSILCVYSIVYFVRFCNLQRMSCRIGILVCIYACPVLWQLYGQLKK
jgi:hypothetical protein